MYLVFTYYLLQQQRPVQIVAGCVPVPEDTFIHVDIFSFPRIVLFHLSTLSCPFHVTSVLALPELFPLLFNCTLHAMEDGYLYSCFVESFTCYHKHSSCIHSRDFSVIFSFFDRKSSMNR